MQFEWQYPANANRRSPFEASGPGLGSGSGADMSLRAMVSRGGAVPHCRELSASFRNDCQGIVSVAPALTAAAADLPLRPARASLPLLVFWVMPKSCLWVEFERDGQQHGVLAKVTGGQRMLLRHVALKKRGALAMPFAATEIDRSAAAPLLDPAALLAAKPLPDPAEDMRWTTWFVNAVQPLPLDQPLSRDEYMAWGSWVARDLAVLAVVFSPAAASTPAHMLEDGRIVRAG